MKRSHFSLPSLIVFVSSCSFYDVQWEFQVGPAVGISAGDELWIARYILEVINVEIMRT